MSIDFSRVTEMSDKYGVITQLELGGRVIWQLQSGGKVVLQVEKITSDTYAAETTYKSEQFILLDIYPKTNGTVSVTYGGLTKTITDTSGAEEPNAQRVYFGTFNGVSDDVATPASGELVIEGDFYTFGLGRYAYSSKVAYSCKCINKISDFGDVEKILSTAFNIAISVGPFTGLTGELVIPSKITSIGLAAFIGNDNLTGVVFDNPYGWYATETEGATSGTALDLTDPVKNMSLLTTNTDDNRDCTNGSHYWYRS